MCLWLFVVSYVLTLVWTFPLPIPLTPRGLGFNQSIVLALKEWLYYLFKAMRGQADFNNHRIPSGVHISQSQVWGAFPGPSGTMLPPQRAHGPPEMDGCLCHPFFSPSQLSLKERKRKVLWTLPFLSQIFRWMNALLGQTQCSEVRAECGILHKRGLKRASGECEESTRERTWRGGSHRQLGVHHCLSHLQIWAELCITLFL